MKISSHWKADPRVCRVFQDVDRPGNRFMLKGSAACSTAISLVRPCMLQPSFIGWLLHGALCMARSGEGGGSAVCGVGDQQ